MRDPGQQFFTSFMLVLGILIGVAIGQGALADPEEQAAKQAPPISTPEAVAEPLTGPQVYNAVCIACHAPPGVGGAPALGDGDAWAPRIAQGMDTLIDHALHGFSGSKGVMPRKGERVDLSDEEIIGAIEYMVEQADSESAAAPRPTVAGSTIDAESGSRLPLLRREDMDDATSVRIYDAVSGPDGEPPRGTLAIALYSPRTAAALNLIDEYLQTQSTLGPRLVGLLGLITAREMSLPWEWSVHEGPALLAGLEPEVIDAVRLNEPLSGLADDDALLIDFGRQLFRNRHVDSATFAALVDRLGRQRAFDAMMALTYPAMAGVMQRAVDQRPPAGWDPAALPTVEGVGTPAGLPGEFVAIGPRPPLPSDVHEDSLYRFPLLGRDELDPEAREIFDRLIGEDRTTTPRGPVGMTFLSPQFVEPVQELNTALRVEGVLDRRTAEIVVTATGREMNSQYQWIVHGATAEREGAGVRVLEAIRDDGDLSELDDRDAVVITFTREIFREGRVESATFDAAVELFGVRGTVEIAALVGDYLMMTTVYNALGMRLRPEQVPTLPHRAGAPIGAEWR